MIIVVVSLLLGATLGIQCVEQTPSWDLTQISGNINVKNVAVSWSGRTSATTCSGSDKCGNIKSLGSYQISGASPSSWKYEQIQKGCASDICINGNQCVKATYTFATSQRQVCGISVDPTTYQASVLISCCSSQSCNQPDIDESACTEDTDFSEYMKKIQNCWDDVYPDYADAICNDPTLATYVQNCRVQPQATSTSSTSSFLTKVNCEYRPTCNAGMKTAIETFAECGCAVTEGGYTGAFMNALMKDNWELYCPNLIFDCTAQEKVSVNLYYVYYRLLIKAAKEETDPQQALILSQVANALNVNGNYDDVLTITITVSGARRLLAANETEITITFKTDDEDMAEYAKNNLNAQLAANISATIGAETTMIGVTTKESSSPIEETYSSSTTEGTEGSDDSSAAQHIVYFMASFAAVIIAGFN